MLGQFAQPILCINFRTHGGRLRRKVCLPCDFGTAVGLKNTISQNTVAHAMSGYEVVHKLVRDGMLRPTTRRHGRRSKVSFYAKMEVRCTCRAHCKQWEEHAVLSFHGHSMHIADQAMLFMMALHNVANHTIHSIGGFTHAATERFKSNLRSHI